MKVVEEVKKMSVSGGKEKVNCGVKKEVSCGSVEEVKKVLVSCRSVEEIENKVPEFKYDENKEKVVCQVCLG